MYTGEKFDRAIERSWSFFAFFIKDAIQQLKQHNRPEKVTEIMVENNNRSYVICNGQKNSSCSISRKQLKSKEIEHKKLEAPKKMLKKIVSNS